MNAPTSEASGSGLDILKWLVVGVLLASGIYGNYFFGSEPVLYRAIALLVIVAIAGFLALKTTKGEVFWQLMKGAKIEARRVVWPTKQECNQTTLIVVAFIIVMALILWGLDSLFGWITSLIIG